MAPPFVTVHPGGAELRRSTAGIWNLERQAAKPTSSRRRRCPLESMKPMVEEREGEVLLLDRPTPPTTELWFGSELRWSPTSISPVYSFCVCSNQTLLLNWNHLPNELNKSPKKSVDVPANNGAFAFHYPSFRCVYEVIICSRPQVSECHMFIDILDSIIIKRTMFTLIQILNGGKHVDMQKDAGKTMTCRKWYHTCNLWGYDWIQIRWKKYCSYNSRVD